MLKHHKLVPSLATPGRCSLSHACPQGQHLVKKSEIQLWRWGGKYGETCQKAIADKQCLTTSPNRKMRIVIAKAAGGFALSSQRCATALPEVRSVSSVPREEPTGSRAHLLICTATWPPPARTYPSLYTNLARLWPYIHPSNNTITTRIICSTVKSVKTALRETKQQKSWNTSTLNSRKVQVSGPSADLHQHIKTHHHQDK